jgi:enoyl-CoA hydratase/carnithine racemase
VLANIVYTTDYERIKNCGLVIEAATENLELKKKIFSNLESIVGEKTILTSNTSSIPADQIFSHLKHPGRTTITHFFAPAWRSMAVEVINWEKADRAVIDFLLSFFSRTGKAPVVTRNVFAFLLNRIFETWASEAAFLLDRATTLQVDSVCEEFVGAGPFFVVTMAGDSNPLTHASQTRRMAERECYKPSNLLLSVQKWRTAKPGTRVDVPEDIARWVRTRMLGSIFSQCYDIADRDIGTRADLNFGSQIALGFKKGVFDIMADQGAKELDRIRREFDNERPGFPQPTKTAAAYLDFNRDILVDHRGGVEIITIRRPQAANALGGGTCDEILDELIRGQEDPAVKGFVITGYGTRAFCAGADIGGFIDTFDNYTAGVALSRGNSKVLEHIDRAEKPVVAALNGLAMGGGVELATRCHSMVATENGYLQLPEITLGIMPGMGGVVVPYRKWPHAAEKFHAMIATAQRLTVQEALEIGMVQKILPDFTSLIDAAVAEVERLQGDIPRIPQGPVAMPAFTVPESPVAMGGLPLSRETLEIFAWVINQAAAAGTLAEALEIAYRGAGDISCTEASKEGVRAFLEKRKPVFAK